MRIKYLSDLHLEFENEKISDYFDIASGVDVVAIAGDISNAVNNVKCLKELSNAIFPIPLVYVAGNHDYYHSSISKVDNKLEKLDKNTTNFHFLNRKLVEISGVTFIGATGWQDDEYYNKSNFPFMNDFRLIKDHNILVNTYGVLDKSFINNALANNKTKKCVVITHSSPCEDVINYGTPEVDHKKDYIEAYYNNWKYLITKHKPEAWITGHCHDRFLNIVDETIVVRNAVGYKNTNRENKLFDRNSILYI